MKSDDDLRKLREQMVRKQLKGRDIQDERLLETMRQIPRHKFVPATFEKRAYDDGALAIGQGQTISQPYVVAYMTQQLQLKGTEKVLEVGTGSGYQAAVLSQLAAYVYSLERFSRLADRAGERLNWFGYENIDIHVGDGSQGLPDMAPFDAIIVTAAAPALPGPLCTQLAPDGGRMVLPVGSRRNQHLQLVIRRDDRWHVKNLIPVRFVPLIGRYGFKPDKPDKPDPDDSNGDSSAGV